MIDKHGYRRDELEAYIRQGDPGRQQKAYNWQTAIGLQAVDGLKTSDYLLQTAREHIEGRIDIDQATDLLKTYYRSRTERKPDDNRTEEADRVAANIARILGTRTLAFNANGLIALHRQLFEGIFKHAGQLRDYNITKEEWVLRGDTVSYLNYEDLRAALDYDIACERDFDYSPLDLNGVVSHIARFVSGLWQIHPFGEGNTRTTAVFTIQYLRSIGFEINNDLFARHSWYFRNALVRSNYKNARLGVVYDFSYLERFFRNLLLGEDNELKNRYLILDLPEAWQEEPNKYRTSTEQVPNKLDGPTEQVRPPVISADPSVTLLVRAIGHGERSVKEMMEAVGLKHRPTFLANYLEPAIREGLVCMRYPDSPRHPRQRYRLTVKGTALLNQDNPQNP